MEPSSQDIQNLRAKFNQRVTDENKDFHPKDLNRAATDDKWLARFLVHQRLDNKEALNMMFETCEWRKSNNVNDINENNINRDYLNEGSVFLHNRDKDGKSLLIFNCRKHEKGAKDFEELKRVAIYWMERAERQDKGEPVSIFFDMCDTGLSSMDLEYTKFIINLFKLYYPNFLNYILIFEMPWIANAAFSIIKSWLPPEAVQKIKRLDKKTLKEYVDKSQALRIWGGEDNFEYVFISENLSENKNEENRKKKRPFILGNLRTPKILNPERQITRLIQRGWYVGLKVHFADGSNIGEPSSNSFGDIKHDESPSSTRLVLNPPDAITFTTEELEISGSIHISNASHLPLVYKVKTTSPDKFRVRPSSGLLSPGSNANIHVVLLAGYSSASILRDKFLVMCYPVEVDNNPNADLNELWKANSSDPKKLEEHKLRCRVPSIQQCPHNGAPGASIGGSSLPSSETEQKLSQVLLAMNHMTDVNTKIQSDLHFLQTLLILLSALVLFFGILTIVILRAPEDDHCHTSLPTSSLVEPPIGIDK